MIARARRMASALVLALSVALGSGPAAFPTPALAAPAFSDAKYAAIVIDANTGEVLYAKRADSQRYPASITKVMTLYLTFEALSTGKLKTTDYVIVSPRAAAQSPSKLGLPAGRGLTVDEAIRAIAIKSANDIAVAMAEKIGGTESRFAALMTLKAQELGMSNSRFVNASGLPDSRQLTTARDIAILSRAVMRDFPQYYPYFSQQTWNFHGQTLRNHNGLLFRMPGVDGIKTGFTNASGFNLTASAVRDGRRLITVVMGGSSTRGRDNHVAELLDTGFDVLKRRERGELITVAQSYFEKAEPVQPAGPVAYASMAPTDGDIGGAISAAMRPAASPVRPAPVKVAAAKPARPEPKAKASGGGFAVQVGSFRSKTDARDWLKESSKRFGKQLASGDPQVLSAGGRHRSVFVGMTKEEATAACKAMKAKRLACMVSGSSALAKDEPVAKSSAKSGAKATVPVKGRKGAKATDSKKASAAASKKSKDSAASKKSGKAAPAKKKTSKS
jgi:D-alanyl-D-alanine carboxypeptidase (penicillin-binding protein 5/6)